MKDLVLEKRVKAAVRAERKKLIAFFLRLANEEVPWIQEARKRGEDFDDDAGEHHGKVSQALATAYMGLCWRIKEGHHLAKEARRAP